ncbi:patatin-like phospholipase family protein [Oscillatoria sp. FACHB-1407]|uniref:patatin-like phospholipase family protein n=1 Tax=Oscillatoria sp. FACHB-1407 TaxID=2692847 RepID=UPI001687701A|nr:patatin-like phospholipase family protein [Oscillatoria sp. FACHB-1407]MBD2461157.1 patatin-like phospholipase family protein [Oscillatoria sp. FACHB-1407]
MADWSFEQVLKEPGLRITPDEKAEILTRMPPPSSQDNQIYIDGVFEGGGVRGIAFLGALRCCADLGFRWRKLAGTSAGAITAAFVAADFQIDDLEQVVGGMDFMQFLTKKTSWLILNGNPADDLRSPVQMMLFLLLARKLGQYSSEPFRAWLDSNLKRRGLATFADIKANPSGLELKVVISDISKGEMLVLPDDLVYSDSDDPQKRSLQQQLKLKTPDDFPIAEAVRLSMSIPLFFEPGELGDRKRKIVDGGILSNFPLWLYDVPPPDVKGSNGEAPKVSVKKCPRWPTFGLRLVEDSLKQSNNITGPFGLLGGMFKTMMVARDRYHLNQRDEGRVINIDVTAAKVTATEFDLSNDKKNILYRQGYLTTKRFFLEKWNWNEHLRMRGFDPNDLMP